MEKFYMKLAERVVSVTANFATTKQYCKGYLLNEIPDKVDIEIVITQQDIDDMRFDDSPDEFFETLVMRCKVAEQFPKFGTVMFHGSAVAVDGEVYVFTAPSGTGKSTHTKLWREYFGEKAVMVNDDKPFLHVTEAGQVIVYGAPWDGKHALSENIGLPLKGICVLSQGKDNRITRLSVKDAFKKVYTQTYRSSINARFTKETVAVLDYVLQYPVWYLQCNISHDAMKLSYETMSGHSLEEDKCS